MPDPVSFVISAGALVISGGTAWLTFLRPGKLKMTRPTLFYFGPDGVAAAETQRGSPKVFIRMLLYSTAKRGTLIENMYIAVHGEGASHNFNIWVYREGGTLSRGSGLFIDQEGVALDHHFLLPFDGPEFAFDPGEYRVDVFVKIVRSSKPRLLGSVAARLPEVAAKDAEKFGGGVFFDWAPDLGTYHAHSRPAFFTEGAPSSMLGRPTPRD